MKEPREVTKNGRPRWMVDLREVGGGRHFFKTKSAALRFQSSSLSEHSEIGSLAFELPHDTRRRYLAAEVRAAKLGATIEQILDWYERTHKPQIKRTMLDAVNECLQAKRKANRRPRYLEQLQYSLESLRDSVGPDAVCWDVTTTAVEAWLNNPAWSARTRSGHLINAGTFFSFCIKRQWLAADPSAAIEDFTLDDTPPGILTVGQVRRLMRACSDKRPGLLPYLTLAVFAGVRPEELKKLSWDDVDLNRGYLEIPAHVAKGRKRRLVKLQPNAIEWLKLKGRLPPMNWRRDFATVRKAAGFAVQGGRAGEAWPHDAARHSFCSYCLPAHGAHKTAEWAGNSEVILYQHYRELVTDEAAKEFWAVTPESARQSG